MTDKQKVGLAILIYLLWPKSTTATVIPAGNTTVGFKSPSGLPLTIKPSPGAQSVDSSGKCYQFDASTNSWYPCGAYTPPVDGQQAYDPTTGECIQYWSAFDEWLSCGTSPV